jgi:hypothetical protein
VYAMSNRRSAMMAPERIVRSAVAGTSFNGEPLALALPRG